MQIETAQSEIVLKMMRGLTRVSISTMIGTSLSRSFTSSFFGFSFDSISMAPSFRSPRQYWNKIIIFQIIVMILYQGSNQICCQRSNKLYPINKPCVLSKYPKCLVGHVQFYIQTEFVTTPLQKRAKFLIIFLLIVLQEVDNIPS